MPATTTTGTDAASVAQPSEAAQPAPDGTAVEAGGVAPSVAAPDGGTDQMPATVGEDTAGNPPEPTDAADVQSQPPTPADGGEAEPAAAVARPHDQGDVGGERPAERPGKVADAPVAGAKRRGALLAALVVAIVIVGVVLVVTRTSDKETPAAQPGASGTTVPRAVPPIPFEVHRDEAAGFSIRYPKAWERVESPDPVVRFMVTDGRNALQVRYAVFEQPITRENIADIKAVSDADLSDEQGKIKILRHQLIEMNGMPGYYYLYTFTDESGVEGAHSRYNLYQGRKAYVLVFQALPVDDFTKVADIFDHMADSFQATPDVGPPPTTDRPPLGFEQPQPGDSSPTGDVSNG